MKRFISKLVLFSVLGCSSLVSTTWASDQPFSVGVLGGMGFYNSSLGNQPTVGIMGNYKLDPNIGVGVIGHIGIMGAVAGAGTITSVSYYNAHINYSLATLLPELPGLWVAARAGIAVIHQSLNTVATGNSAAFDLGPAVGYDYMLSSDFSLGLDLSYLFATSANPSGTNSMTVSSFNSLVALKYYF